MMFKKVLKFCAGAVSNFSGAFSQTGEIRYLPTEMINRQEEYNSGCYEYACMPKWSNAGITGKYSIAGTWLVRQAFGSCFNEADSFLGFCRAVQLYKMPSSGVLGTLLNNRPQQPWLDEIYKTHVTAYQKLAMRDCEKQSAKLLAYSTCADLDCEKLKDDLLEVRKAINEKTWTLADAYVFLGVYPSKHYFGWGDLSKLYQEEYALCIADSLRTILVAQEELEWDEMVRRSKQFEEEERAADLEKAKAGPWSSQDVLRERFSSWGSEDVQRENFEREERRRRQATEAERIEMHLPQSELDRLYKLDVARAYLFVRRSQRLGPSQF